jgi:hypothetical protein
MLPESFFQELARRPYRTILSVRGAISRALNLVRVRAGMLTQIWNP